MRSGRIGTDCFRISLSLNPLSWSIRSVRYSMTVFLETAMGTPFNCSRRGDPRGGCGEDSKQGGGAAWGHGPRQRFSSERCAC